MLEDPADPDAALAAAVSAACVEVSGASPGSCTAACGSTDGEALMPGAALAEAAPTSADPTVNEPAAGAVADDVDVFDETVFEEAMLVELPLQLSAIERLPTNEPPAEQGVAGRLATFIVVVSNAEAVLDDADVAGAGVPTPGVDPVCETVCAWAAGNAASQRIIREPAVRCTESSWKCR